MSAAAARIRARLSTSPASPASPTMDTAWPRVTASTSTSRIRTAPRMLRSGGAGFQDRYQVPHGDPLDAGRPTVLHRPPDPRAGATPDVGLHRPVAFPVRSV